MSIELIGERLRARAWRIGDGDIVWPFVREQEGIFSRPGEINSLADAEGWVGRQVELQADPVRTQYRFALELIDGGALIGGARINIEDSENRQASLGYALHRSHWGKGYATEAATLMLTFAFKELSIHRVEALVDPSNERSQRVIAKLGLRREGHMKGRFLEHDRWLDADVYAITEDEWRAR